MAIEMLECPACSDGRGYVYELDGKFYGRCNGNNCLCNRAEPTRGGAVDAWNTMVEEIRVGRAIGTLLDAYPEKPWVLAAESPSFNLGSSHEEVENYIKWRICRRPVPAPALDPLDVIRELQSMLDSHETHFGVSIPVTTCVGIRTKIARCWPRPAKGRTTHLQRRKTDEI